MPRAKRRLELLKRLAAAREREAAARLNALEAEHAAQHAQAEALDEMLAAYGASADSAADRGAQERLRRFYGRLRESRQVQGLHVERLRDRSEQSRGDWHSAYRHRKGLEKLAEARQQEERRLRSRKARRADGRRRWAMLNRNSDLENH